MEWRYFHSMKKIKPPVAILDEMRVDIYAAKDGSGDIWLLHDVLFPDNLAYLLYSIRAASLDFVYRDGSIKPFGAPINAGLRRSFESATQVKLIFMEQDQPRDIGIVPLSHNP